jgi:hydroxymethylpyrimidine pyrophosphatase-like HAD family hydrolase
MPLRSFVEERISKYNKTFRQIEHFDGLSPDNIVYFMTLDRRERLIPVREAISALCGVNTAMYEDVYRPGYWYLEAFSGNASKRTAVIFLREKYGFTRVVCFGDNFNDLPMFEASDCKVAVENAIPALITAADCVCGGNDADGVAKWLYENI